MKVNMNLTATINVDDTSIYLHYDTDDHDEQQIGINGDSIFNSCVDSQLTKMENIKDLPDKLLAQLKLLYTDYSVMPDKSYAVLSNKTVARKLESETGNELDRIITGIEYTRLNERKRRAYKVLTPENEMISDRYALMNDILSALKNNISSLVANIYITTSKSDVTIRILKDKLYVSQDVTINGKKYKHLTNVNVAAVDNEAKDLNKLLITDYLRNKLCMDLRNKDIFTTPLYICRLKEECESDSLPYIQAFADYSDIPSEYKILHVDKLLHEQYLKLLCEDEDTPVHISIDEVCDCIEDTFAYIRNNGDTI